MGIPETLSLEENALRERFYALSRKLHPDNYAQAAADQALYATRWTTLLNRAFQQLRNPTGLAEYVLDLHGRGENAKESVPVDLAESYFELQDALSEPGGHEKLARFKGELQEKLSTSAQEMTEIQDTWKKGQDQTPLLARLQAVLTRQRYLKSMLADIEKRKSP